MKLKGLSYCIVYPDFVVQRDEKFGGTVRFSTYEELAEAYGKEEVYPLDLKNAVTVELNKVNETGLTL